jgi:hypothetical protein
MPYPDPRAAASPQVGHPVPDHRGAQFSVGNALAELDLERLPAHQKKVESDWFAIFNPMVPRVLDVDLVHTLQHESVVCCVRFSHDGKYVATGCNRSAQIFDVVTGQKLFTLQDESVDAVGDLYIRRSEFGISLLEQSETPSLAMSKTSTLSILPVMDVPLLPAVEIALFASGILKPVKTSSLSALKMVSLPSLSLQIRNLLPPDLLTRAFASGMPLPVTSLSA